jgi:hypothetical protein
MRPGASRFTGKAEFLMLGIALASGGCNELIGLTGYTTAADASTPQKDTAAQSDSSIVAVEASCEGDSSGSCYACTPVTTPQFLNACTTATCVPFDDLSRLTHLLPDGSLPPLPPIPEDGGGD